MIAKGNAHAHGAKLGVYLVTGKDGEKARLHELRGFAEDNVVDAFRSVHIMAGATKCEKPLFHLQVRNPAGEHLTREQWEKVADRIEHKLALTDQPRAIAFHEKDGQEHMHVAWSRIDDETMTAKPLPFYKLRLKEVCRELERELDLTRVRNQREAHEPRAASRAEFEEARRKGADLNEVRVSIRQAWEQSDTGSTFAAALKERGFALAQGDRRDYVVIDQQGSLHALGKRLLGVSAAETRARLDDLDRSAMPTVAEARENQAAACAVAVPPPTIVAPTVEPRPKPEPKSAAVEPEPSAPAGTIADAKARYGRAYRDHYDPENPYASLAKVAAVENAVFKAEQQELDRRINQEQDPEQRRYLEIRKQIEGCDYMVITCERLAVQSEINAGRKDSADAVFQREKARLFEARAQDLQRELKERQRRQKEAELERRHGYGQGMGL